MGGKTEQTQQQQQSTVSNPWAPAQPLLQDVLGRLGGIDTSVTPGQSQAFGNLWNKAASLPDYSSSINATAGNLFGGGKDFSSFVMDPFNKSSAALAPYLDPSYLNPMTTPGFSDALKTAQGDITNSIVGRYAGAGRDMSPAEATALGRGLSQGTGSLIADQFNRNVAAQQGAAGQLFGQGTGAASALSGLQQTQLGNQLQGTNLAGSIPGLMMVPAQSQLNVANAGYSMPFSNLSQLTGLLNPIAALGGQSNTSGTTTTSQQTPWYNNVLGGLMGGAGMLGKMGGLGSIGSGLSGGLSSAAGLMSGDMLAATAGAGLPLADASMMALPFMFSDARVKTDIAPVGELYDGSPVYSYKYKGSDVPQIGLMAQDVEETRPDAVVEIGGVKAVDYGKATERARMIGAGMLDPWMIEAAAPGMWAA